MSCADPSRRRLLQLLAGTTVLSACDGSRALERWALPITVHLPGLREGHQLRQQQVWPAPSASLRTRVAILGSGVAGITTAWKLAKEGLHDVVLVSGPEWGGNANAGQWQDCAYPRGAHYLPLPALESTHVREMLLDVGVIEAEAFGLHPRFDERVVVHAPEERLLFQGRWQEGLLPQQGLPAAELAQQQRFFQHVETLKHLRGADGRKVFAMPLALSSTDPRWRAWDRLSFKAWLEQQGYTAPSLHWYLNYACRDDYGAEYQHISAWAGLHYFASRAGGASNAEPGAVLTWPGGLAPLMQQLWQQAQQRAPSLRAWPGFAVQVEEHSQGVRVLCAQAQGGAWRTCELWADRVVLALPLHVARHVWSTGPWAGLPPLPDHAPWLVANFMRQGFPVEAEGAPLAWDNVVYQGQGLGYVVSTHQDIRQARPERTVFTAYQALSQQSPAQIRSWLQRASAAELYEAVASDLHQAYGSLFRWGNQAVEITVRGHAMASPAPGFLSHPTLLALRGADQKILFAHADLSGLSVFEEASWWGYQAALKLLG